MKTFPRRTVLLMVLALLAFARLWWVTHATNAASVTEVHLVQWGARDAGTAR